MIELKRKKMIGRPPFNASNLPTGIFFRKTVYLCTDHQTLEPLNNGNRANRFHNLRLTAIRDKQAHLANSL